VNNILNNDRGKRILVIENEVGEAGIDNELLIKDDKEEIILMNNGCICCSVRGDLVKVCLKTPSSTLLVSSFSPLTRPQLVPQGETD